ncbi:MAG TPA: hypothetical protein PLA24_10315 [Tenuifilaceae bacterium]|nr:hypothetical protein [Tenuifilaceae bacterium]
MVKLRMRHSPDKINGINRLINMGFVLVVSLTFVIVVISNFFTVNPISRQNIGMIIAMALAIVFYIVLWVRYFKKQRKS